MGKRRQAWVAARPLFCVDPRKERVELSLILMVSSSAGETSL